MSNRLFSKRADTRASSCCTGQCNQGRICPLVPQRTQQVRLPALAVQKPRRSLWLRVPAAVGKALLFIGLVAVLFSIAPLLELTNK